MSTASAETAARPLSTPGRSFSGRIPYQRRKLGRIEIFVDAADQAAAVDLDDDAHPHREDAATAGGGVQDVLLDDVENGIVILIGATTENPFFSVVSALVSRSTIFEFKPLKH